MNETETNIENVTISELLAMDTWNRQRTDEELESFIKSRETAVANL